MGRLITETGTSLAIVAANTSEITFFPTNVRIASLLIDTFVSADELSTNTLSANTIVGKWEGSTLQSYQVNIEGVDIKATDVPPNRYLKTNNQGIVEWVEEFPITEFKDLDISNNLTVKGYISAQGNLSANDIDAKSNILSAGVNLLDIFSTAAGSIDGSGTANTVAKFSDSNTITDSNISDNGNTVTIASSLSSGNLFNITNDGDSKFCVAYDGSTTIQGNLSVHGDMHYIDTNVTVTSALSIINSGTGPALYVEQKGTEPIAHFIDKEGDDIIFDDNGRIGLGLFSPEQKLTVAGGISASEGLSANNLDSAFNILSAGTDLTNIFGPGGSAGNLDGSGTGGKIPVWSDSNTLGDSPISSYGVGIKVTGDLQWTGNATNAGNGNVVMGTGCLKFADDGRIAMGDSNDLLICHSGSHSIICENGTGGLKIMTGDLYLRTPGDVDMIYATSGGAAKLYYNGSEKLATTNTGVTVTGNVSASDGLSANNLNSAYNIISAGTDLVDIFAPASGGGYIDGSGSANTIAKFSDSNTIADSCITDDGSTVKLSAPLSGDDYIKGQEFCLGANSRVDNPATNNLGLYANNELGLELVSDTRVCSHHDLTVNGTISASSNLSAGGRFFAPNGSAAAPTFSFSDFPGTGLLMADTDTLGIATRGSVRMVVDESGCVGIGTATPTTNFQVHDGGIYAGNGATKGYGFHDFGTGWGYKGVTGPSRLGIFTDTVERITVASNGKVGIGVTNPGVTLTVQGGISASGGLSAGNLEIIGGSGTTNFLPKFTDSDTLGDSIAYVGSDNINIEGGLSALQGLSADNNIYGGGCINHFVNNVGINVANPSEKLTIQGALSSSNKGVFHKIGLGTNGPDLRLEIDVDAADDGILLTANNGARKAVEILAESATNGGADIKLYGGVNGLCGRFTTGNDSFLSGTDFGIGTSSPAAPFHVKSTTSNTKMRLTNDNSTNWDFTVGNTGYYQGNLFISNPAIANEQFTLGSTGNVGINVFNPTEKLTVQGVISSSNKGVFDKIGVGVSSPNAELHVSNSGAPTFRLSRTGTGQIWQQSIDSSGRFLLTEAASEGGTQYNRLGIDDAGDTCLVPVAGNVGVGITSPGEKLTVAGGISASDGLSANNLNSASSIISAGTDLIDIFGPGGSLSGVDGSGTACYLPVWSDSNTIGNSIACQTSTQLTVAGNVSACGSLSADGQIYICNSTDSNVALYIDGSSNYEGIQFRVNGDDETYITPEATGSMYYGAVNHRFRTSANGGGANTIVGGTTRMVIADDGNVGIGAGDNAPGEKLTVAGGISASEGLSAGKTSYFADKVGIGTNYPSSILNLNDANNNDAHQLTFSYETGGTKTDAFTIGRNSSTGNLEFQSDVNNHGFEFCHTAAGTQEFNVINMDVGIGTNAPGEKLTVAGGISASEGLSAGKCSYFAGKVGIGTTAPMEALQLADGCALSFGYPGNDLKIQHDGANSYITEQGTGDLYIQPNTSGAMYVRDGTSGNVMIAAKTGSGKIVELYAGGDVKLRTSGAGLNIFGSISASDGLSANNINSASSIISAGTDLIDIFGPGGSLSGVDGSGDACYLPVWSDSNTVENSIACQSTNLLTVQGNISAHGALSATNSTACSYFAGNVGIGTTAPGSILELQGCGGNNKQLRLASGSSAVYWDIGRNFNTGHFEITEDSGSTYFLIDKDNGNVGIGLTTPGEKLTVQGTVSASGVKVPDNSCINIGTGNDLRLQHTGSESQIFNNTGQLDIRTPSRLLVTSSGGDEMIRAEVDGSVCLYYDDSAKLCTTNTGINVTGTITSDGHDIEGDLTVQGSISSNGIICTTGSIIRNPGTTSSGGLCVRDCSNARPWRIYGTGPGGCQVIETSGTSNPIHFGSELGGAINIKTCDTTRMFISGGGHAIGIGSTNPTSTMMFADNCKLAFGDGSDVCIYHDGTDSYVDNGIGDLILRTAGSGDDVFVRAVDDVFIQPGNGASGITARGGGAVELYYNGGNKKLETTNTGVTVTGNVSASGNLSASELNIPDYPGRVTIGNSDDLQLWHSGSVSYIRDMGTGGLHIQTDGPAIYLQDTDGNAMAQFTANGGNFLYFNKELKFNTTNTGVTVAGNVSASDGLSANNLDSAFNILSAGTDLIDIFGPGGSAGNINGSGTACYLPVWSDTDTIGNSIACQTSTQLTVAGNISACGSLSASGDVNYFAGKVGIGIDPGTRCLYVNGYTAAGGVEFLSGVTYTNQVRTCALEDKTSSGYAKIAFGGSNCTMAFCTDSTSRMFLNASGNLGIGTETPYAYDTTATRLHVTNSGSACCVSEVARFEGSSDADGSGGIIRLGTSNDRGIYLEGGRTGSVPYASIGTTEYDGTKTEGIRVDSAGNVGIGISSPGEKLTVQGNISASGNGYFACVIAGGYFEEKAAHPSLAEHPTGSLVVIGENGKLELSTTENDKKVFGVTQCGASQPIILGAEPVLVTGNINVGDFITTSDQPGHGKRSMHTIHGAVIAQSMESGTGKSHLVKAMIRKM